MRKWGVDPAFHHTYDFLSFFLFLVTRLSWRPVWSPGPLWGLWQGFAVSSWPLNFLLSLRPPLPSWLTAKKVVEKICRSESTPDLRSNVGCCGLTPILWRGLLRALLLSGWVPVLKGGERLQSTQEKCRLRGLILTMIFCSGMDCVSDPKKGGRVCSGRKSYLFL